MLWPSTPAAPRLRATFRHAASRLAGRLALSTKLNHLPPWTPLTSADTMRSVQIEASIHHQRRASVPCLASGHSRDCSCSILPSRIQLPARPSLEPVLLAGPLAACATAVLCGL